MPRRRTKDSKNSKSKQHGERLYNIWTKMKGRCFNKNNDSYEKYGGRGITVFGEWVNDFTLFYEWSINNGYGDDLTIDRINNDGNYEPSNCRWATRTTQNRNKRNNHYIEINGVVKLARDWEKEYGLTDRLIYSRIGKGYSGEDLIKDKIEQTINVDTDNRLVFSVNDIHNILRMFDEGKNNKQIADIYGVATSTIRRIRIGQTWSHITGFKERATKSN